LIYQNLGEGWDFPILDGVVFAENMTSNIRIVQSALRANRKNLKELTKKTKIILPILYKDDWLEENDNLDLKKVREVIYQMGLEDETITQKIKVFKITIEKQSEKDKKDKKNVNEFGEYDEELTQKLRLKTINRIVFGITYEKAKKIIAEKNIKDKETYYQLCDHDIRLSKEPEIIYKGKFDWIEYFQIDRNDYYDLDDCKNKVSEYLLLHPDIKKYHLDLSIVSKKLCELNNLFPPNGLWTEFYKVNKLSDIIIIKNIHKKKQNLFM